MRAYSKDGYGSGDKIRVDPENSALLIAIASRLGMSPRDFLDDGLRRRQSIISEIMASVTRLRTEEQLTSVLHAIEDILGEQR
jgi:hypothetical protein